MIDKIIFNLVDRSTLFDEIYKMDDPRLLFLFYYYNRDFKTDLIVDKLIELNNKRYLHFLIRIIDPLYHDKLVLKLINFSDPKLLYYVAFDTKELDIKNLKLIFNKLITLDDIYYNFLFYNYFFLVKKLNDDEIRSKYEKLFKENDINIDDINEDNVNSYIVKLKNLENININGYSNNCYEKRNMIPDMIVCHISNNYESALNTFFNDESEVSSHFVIARDGRVKEVIPLKSSAWANGTSVNDTSDIYYNFSSLEEIRKRKTNANFYSFSIEHESFDGSLTKEQYEASLDVMSKIIDYIKCEYNYNFKIDRSHIVGHDEVNPIVRTSCPGSLFPFDEIINDLKKKYK